MIFAEFHKISYMGVIKIPELVPLCNSSFLPQTPTLLGVIPVDVVHGVNTLSPPPGKSGAAGEIRSLISAVKLHGTERHGGVKTRVT